METEIRTEGRCIDTRGAGGRGTVVVHLQAKEHQGLSANTGNLDEARKRSPLEPSE